MNKIWYKNDKMSLHLTQECFPKPVYYVLCQQCVFSSKGKTHGFRQLLCKIFVLLHFASWMFNPCLYHLSGLNWIHGLRKASWEHEAWTRCLQSIYQSKKLHSHCCIEMYAYIKSISKLNLGLAKSVYITHRETRQGSDCKMGCSHWQQQKKDDKYCIIPRRVRGKELAHHVSFWSGPWCLVNLVSHDWGEAQGHRAGRTVSLQAVELLHPFGLINQDIRLIEPCWTIVGSFAKIKGFSKYIINSYF